jgi:hypothetical protein
MLRCCAGETRSCKEIRARVIHQQSWRNNGRKFPVTPVSRTWRTPIAGERDHIVEGLKQAGWVVSGRQTRLPDWDSRAYLMSKMSN